MKGFAISLGLHLAVLFALFYQWPAAPVPATVPHTAVKLFVPADATTEKPPPQKHADKRAEVRPQITHPKTDPQSKLDLASIQLTIEDDVAGEMIVVLKSYRGKIAIVDSGTRAVQQAFWASTGKPAGGVTIADGMAILLGKPEYWPDVAALEHRAQVDSTVCALFPPGFADALGGAIQRKAAELGVVDIKGATFAFSSHERSGIIVRRVT